MRELTFICAYFENLGMLIEQSAIWSAFPPEVQQHLHMVVSDDCCPRHPAKDAFSAVDIASYQLYRNHKKRDWNWLFARNLGVEKARTDWVLLTDIDHVLT